MTDEKKQALTTPEFIGSFICVLEPQERTNDDGTSRLEYGLTAVFPPDGNQKYLPGEADLTEIRRAATAAAVAKFGEEKFRGFLKSGKFRSPFLKDDEACEKYGWPAGSTFIRLKSRQRPGVVSCYKGPDGRPLEMTTGQIEEHLFPGSRMRATVRPFAYDHPMGGKGVSIALNNIQWLGTDTRIDGKASASSEFEATAEVAEMDPGADGGNEQETPPVSESNPAKKRAAPIPAKKTTAPQLKEAPDLSLVL